MAYNSILPHAAEPVPYRREGEFSGDAQEISPAAWQHIHFLSHYLIRDNTAFKNLCDLGFQPPMN
jgi:hypothetical protein